MNLATQFPDNWQTLKLGEIISDLRGGAPLEPEDFVDKGFPVLHKGAIKPFGFIEIDKKKKTFTHDTFVKKHLNAVVTQKYVAVTLRDLVPSGPSIGLMAYLKSRSFQEYLLAQGSYAFLVDESIVSPQYLVYLSNTIPYRKYIRSIAVGSTQIHVRTSEFKEMIVPLPPLPEQKRIAAILDKADRLRCQRRFAQKLSDSFLQSVFVKMFGEPVSNPMSWDISLLGKAVVTKDGIKAGPFGSSIKKESYSETGYRVYGQEQVIVDNYRIGNYRISETKFQEMKTYAVQADDVLISLVGTFGKVSIVPKDAEAGIINPRLIRLRLNQDKLKPQFFVAMFRNQSFLRKMEIMSHGGTMGVLNGAQLKETEIILPPLSLQEKFAEIVQKFERIRRQQREATRQAEHLFQTLLHRAFRGEL